MRIVFMGTPDFSVPVLEELIKAGHQIGYVVTQPDRARNRGKKIQYSPVKELALQHEIPLLQPERIKMDQEVVRTLRAYMPDIIVVVAYGQIIQKEILDLPRYGCVNVHASLLPKLRGASPIQHAILQGETVTGVTIMKMEEGLDTGDMLSKVEIPVDGKNGAQLHDALSRAGAELLVRTLPLIEAGKIRPEKQDDCQATYAGLISKEDGKIDFEKSPVEIERQIRAFDPWPGAYCDYGGMQLKLWKAYPMSEKSSKLANGTIAAVSGEGIDIVCGGKILRVTEIQFPGKKRVEVSAFLRGNTIDTAVKLG